MVNYSPPSLFFTFNNSFFLTWQTCVSDSGCCHGPYPHPRVFNSAAMEFSAQRLPLPPFSEPGCGLAWLEGSKSSVPGGRSSRAWWQGHPHCSCSRPAWCWLKGLELSMHGVLRALNVPCCRKLKLGRGGRNCSCLSCFRFHLLLPALRFGVLFSLAVTGISIRCKCECDAGEESLTRQSS